MVANWKRPEAVLTSVAGVVWCRLGVVEVRWDGKVRMEECVDIVHLPRIASALELL